MADPTVRPRPTPRQALLRGHVSVTLPVLMILGAAPVVGAVLAGWQGAICGSIAGTFFAWPWWSYAVPRWRDWVLDHGLRPRDVQASAEAIGLLWPEGSWFERTEFRRRDGRKGW